MNLPEYLRSKMQDFKDCKPFGDSNLTYGELTGLLEKGGRGSGRLRAVKGGPGIVRSLEIFKLIFRNDVAVPLSDNYGEVYGGEIERRIEKYDGEYPGLAFVVFTSGTTGVPKGVMLSEDNILSNLKMIEGYFNLKPRKKILICRPLSHIAVITGELLYGLSRGLEIHFFDGPFNPVRLAEYIQANGIQVLCCTPTMIYYLSKVIKKHSLETVSLSGERLRENTLSVLSSAFPETEFYNAYGMSEHSPRISALLPRDFFKKPGSAGKPLECVNVKLDNGELCVRSPAVMRGYLDGGTEEKIKNGWLYTGDSAEIDGEGYLYIKGRKDCMIQRGGVNVYPAEIEGIVSLIPGVELCRAYGEVDRLYGQKICLQVQGGITLEKLRRELLVRLPARLMPQKLEITDKLELTSSGKVKV